MLLLYSFVSACNHAGKSPISGSSKRQELVFLDYSGIVCTVYVLIIWLLMCNLDSTGDEVDHIVLTLNKYPFLN